MKEPSVQSSAANPSIFYRIASELGVHSILSSPRDTKLLCLQRFTRLFAYGASTLILALYLSSLGNSDTRIGLFMTLTLLGDVAISFLLTLVADGLGRRRILVLGAALMSASGLVFAFSDNYWVLVAASVLGVISPSGNEIGPFRAIEESTLAQLTPSAIRSDIFAWYTLIGTAGAAFGTITCGWLVQLMIAPDRLSEITAYRMVYGAYAALGLVKLLLSLMLSKDCEPEPPRPEYQQVVEMDAAYEAEGLLSDSENESENDEDEQPRGGQDKKKVVNKTPHKPSMPKNTPTNSQPPKTKVPQKQSKLRSLLPTISPSSLITLLQLSALFAIDSLASGLVPTTWTTYFFHTKFALPTRTLGSLFFFTNLLASLSNLLAVPLAKRIGLVKTMVFTHLPSAIFLALIPVPSVPWLAMLFLLLRSCLSSMDQAPRQAFLAAVVLPGERTAVMGMVNVVKTLAQSGGPVVTGYLAGGGRFWVAFLVAGGLKAGYDLGLLTLFLGFRSREEEEEEEAVEGRGAVLEAEQRLQGEEEGGMNANRQQAA